MAKSSVATSSLFAGAPHDEQKRPVTAISVPQALQVGMDDTVYRDCRNSVSHLVLPSKR